MSETVTLNEPVRQQRGRLHGIAAGLTLFIGVGAAILAIWHFSPPPPVVVQPPPEIKTVEKLVYVPKPVPVPAPPPVLAPAVELPRLLTPPPPPPEPPRLTAGAWDGVWRRKESPLPMFKLHQEDKGVAGTCGAANWGDVVAVRGGDVSEGVLELVVDDALCRVHIRMALSDPGKAKVEQWVTDADWMAGLERANKKATTPQQAAVIKAALRRDAQKFRKPVPIGVFTRQSDD